MPPGEDNLKTAWVTYTFGADWLLVLGLRRTRSRASPTLPSGPATLNIGAADADALRFMVQAANGAALVGIDDNLAAYHSLASTAAGVPARDEPGPGGVARPRRIRQHHQRVGDADR